MNVCNKTKCTSELLRLIGRQGMESEPIENWVIQDMYMQKNDQDFAGNIGTAIDL